MKISEATHYLLPLGAGAALIETLVLAWNDRVSAATLTAGLFCVLVLFHYFPQLESFKAFTIEAKLRQTLGEADRVLANLRRLAHLSANQMLYQSALQGRFGGGEDFKEKVQLAEEVSSFLKDLDFDEATIRKANYPLLGILAVDLQRPLVELARRRMETIRQRLEEERNAIFGGRPIDMNAPQYQDYVRLTEAISALKLPSFDFDSFKADPTPPAFDNFCTGLIEQPFLPEADRQKLHVLRREVVSLYEASYNTGNVTKSCQDFVTQRGSWDRQEKLYNEIFGNAEI